jgi:hypothetical protein
MKMSNRETVIALIETLKPSCPESVADAALDILAKRGLDAALAEVRRAYDHDCQEIAKVLLSFGDTFSGGDEESAMSSARDWVRAGIYDGDVASWCRCGVWDADTAKGIEDEGYEPRDLRNVDSELIYAVCNGDKKVAELIAAIEEQGEKSWTATN